MSALDELEKMADGMERAMEMIHARQLRALLPRLRTEERDGKREAFVEGSDWRVHHQALSIDCAEKEAEKRYP